METKDLFDSTENLTVQEVAAKLNELNKSIDSRFQDLRSQVDQLKTNTSMSNKRMIRIVTLLDEVLENFPQITTVLNTVGERLCEQKDRIDLVAGSAATNKRNLNELSKYLKQVSKTLNVIQKEVDRLKDEESSGGSHIKIKVGTLIAVILTIAGWLFKGDHLQYFIEFLAKSFGGQ